jgi:hypothetical protein
LPIYGWKEWYFSYPEEKTFIFTKKKKMI